MLVVGAGGFAKQLIEIFNQLNQLKDVVLFDNYTYPLEDRLYGLIPIIHSYEEVQLKFKSDSRFTLGIGNPEKRLSLAEQFIKMGGRLESVISPHAIVSRINTQIGEGTVILTNSIVENGVRIGKGVLINIGTFITHDTSISDYAELCPGVRISGGCSVGSSCFLGTGSILLPKVHIGNGSIVAAGSVVTKNVPERVLVAGVPAVIKKSLKF
jgi:sugar O-acyltransferase (sialic acid O-acetyltransferase NeuD family)